MRLFTIALDESLLPGTEDLEGEARFLLALKLFELRRASAGKAAELSGLSKAVFLKRASDLGTPVVDLDQEQLDVEFAPAD